MNARLGLLVNRSTGAAHSLLRAVAGLLFLCHGAMKLLGWFGGMPAPAAGGGLSALTVASGAIELVGGVAILLGLFTRLAAFLASGEMAVAYFMVHFPQGLWPIQNKGELAVLYCFIFLFLAAAGPGPLSLDYLIQRKHAANRGSGSMT
jgi:putative oxidoreductase